MKWKIITVGKPALEYARIGADDYLRRLQRYTGVELIPLKSGSREDVAARALRASAGYFRIALDECGQVIDTQTFRQWIDRWEMDAVGAAAMIVGGADGHPARVREEADLVLSLGKMTLQHELALVVALEQLYRVYTLKKGDPYHR